jgi:methyl-accepting chemotaxis protein
MFENLKVTRKLALAFGLLVLLTLAMAGAGVKSLGSLKHAVDDIAIHHSPGIMYAGQWHAHLEGAARHMRSALLVSPEGRKAEIEGVRAMRTESERMRGELVKITQEGNAKKQIGALEETRKSYLALENEFLQLAEAGRVDEALEHLLAKVNRVQIAYVDGVDRIADAIEEEEREEVREAYATYHAGLNQLIAAAGFCALLGILFGWMVSRSITVPIAQAVTAANRIADGDLTQEIESTRRDEPGLLLQAMAEMTRKLRQLVGEVSNGAAMVAQASTQIAQGNVDLSQRTEEQASTLEETASSMEELTSSVTQNADHARQASQLAVTASDVARKGGDVVGQVVQTMTGISDSSRQISEIIGVIDGIAFQTNILALNAAVEAARAGDQGRGFAVVAAEVRNLAQRSAAAAKEIKTLIGNSVEQVEAGSRLVEAAGHTMEDIVASVRKVSDLIGEIAAASQEQSSGIEQVNTAVTAMDQVVQQNASLVEEAAAATESMKAQAAALLKMVTRFRIDGVEAHAMRMAVEAPAKAEAEHRPAAAAGGAIPYKPAVVATPHFAAATPARPRGAANGEWSTF